MDYYQTLKKSIEKIMCDANQTEYYSHRVMHASELIEKIKKVIDKIELQKRIDEGKVRLFRAKIPEYNIDVIIDEIEYKEIYDKRLTGGNSKRVETECGLIVDIPLY
ncbi:MAG: hypothetical protein II306_06355 [Clostridia bacterium]|nr:hypothetical protein [Clostridia bacterium]